MKAVKRSVDLTVSEKQLLDLLIAIDFKWPTEFHNVHYIAQDHDSTLRLFYSPPTRDKGDIGLNLTNVVKCSEFIIQNIGTRIKYWYRAYTTRQQYMAYRKEKGKDDDKKLSFDKSKLKTIIEFNLDEKDKILEIVKNEKWLNEKYFYHGLTRDEKSMILEPLSEKTVFTENVFTVPLKLEKYLQRSLLKLSLTDYQWQIFDKRIKYVALGKYRKIIMSSGIITFNKQRERWEPLDGYNSRPEVFIDIPYTEFIECATKAGFDVSLLQIDFNGIIPEYSLTKRPEGKKNE